MTIRIRNAKPANKLLIEDVEWDEEHLKSLHITKEQAVELYQMRGYDFRDCEYIGTVTEAPDEEDALDMFNSISQEHSGNE